MPTAFDFVAKRAALGVGVAALDVPTFYDECKAAQATAEGILYPPIASAAGKYDLGGGRLSGLIVALRDNWQAVFNPGSYQATVDGGVLIGGIAGQPLAYSAGVQIVLNRPADAFIVSSTGSTGPTAADIAAAVAAAVVPVNVVKINGTAVAGSGTDGDPWR